MQQSEFNWRTRDGINIFAKIWKPENDPQAVICLVHGMGEHCSRYQHLADYYTKKGYAIIANDHRGHGKSDGKRGHCPTYSVFMDEISRLLEEAESRFPGKPVFLYGHSLGGNLVLNFLLKHKPKIQGVVVTSPWIRLAFAPPAFMIMLGKVARKIAPSFSQSSKLDTKHLSHDKQVIDKYINDPLIHDKISSEMGMAVMDAGEWLLSKPTTVDIPLLIMHGTGDQITSADATTEFSKLVTGDVTLKLWEGMYHETHNEVDHLQVFDFTTQWLGKYKA